MARHYGGQPQPIARGQQPKLAVVISVCAEDITFLNQVGCAGKVFYIFLKCAPVKTASDVVSELEPIGRCVEMIKVGGFIY